MSTLQMWLWLATREGVGARTQKELLEAFGTPEAIYSADQARLAMAAELRHAQVQALCDHSFTQVEKITQDCQRLGIRILTYADSIYPERLRNIPDPPLVLYIRGTLPDLDAQPALAIVGTRHASAYGMKTAETLSAQLSDAGFVIASGMAQGIDGAAARGTLRAGGMTVAVLGCGADICYPHEHQRLMGDIMMSGAIISEYPPGTAPSSKNFPMRNRIISGLSIATLVIEAPKRSGSLITAHIALDQGRDVFVVPGNIDLASFAGSNQLLAEGCAYFVSSASDIIREYAAQLPKTTTEQRARKILMRQTAQSSNIWDKLIQQPKGKKAVKAKKPDLRELHLNEKQQAIYKAVCSGAGAIEEIIEKSGLEAQEVTVETTILEMDGILTRDAEGKLLLPKR